MRPKSLVLLLLALGCGLVASIGISQVMDKNRSGDAANLDMDAVYIAKVDINLGDPIKSDMVILDEWPKGKIPAGALRELADLEDRRPRTKIFAGEPLLEGKLLKDGEDADATETIPKNFRVLPISVKADTGMAGLINPGDRVDVQWFVPRNRTLGIEKTSTKTILQNIRVFAIDQTVRRLDTGEESPVLAKTVSLLVTPRQANMVRLADKVGEISLVARHPDDPDIDDATEVDFESLMAGDQQSSRERERESGKDEKKAGGLFGAIMSGLTARAATSAAAAAAVEVTPPFRMEVIVGDEVEELLFSPTDGRPLREDEQSVGAGGTPDFGLAPTGASTGDSSDGDDNDFPIELDE